MFHLYQVSQLTTLMPPSTENRLALSAYSSPRWVACKKHVFAKQTSLQLRSGAGNSARTVPGRDSKYLAGPSQSALGRLQKNTFLQNKHPCSCAPEAGIPPGPSLTETRNTSPAPHSPRWVACKKTRFCKTNALTTAPPAVQTAFSRPILANRVTVAAPRCMLVE